MIRTILITFFVLFGISNSCLAQNDARIEALEKEVAELNERLSEIVLLLTAALISSQEQETSQEMKTDLSNWRKLKTGMGKNKVIELLGEPNRVNGGKMAEWFYSSDGSVQFYDNKLYSWGEPLN